MIEVIFLNYLKNHMDVPVLAEHTDTADEKKIVIEKTGSTLGNLVHSATFSVQSYGGSMYESAELNKEVIDVCMGATECKQIFNVELISDYNFPDLTKKKYRYQAVIRLTYIL